MTPDPSEIAQVAAQYSIPPAVLYAVGQEESGYSDAVISGQQTSSAGAVGAFQFMPSTAASYGYSVQQLAGNFTLQLTLAARMLHDLYSQYGNWSSALSAYNSGSPTGAPSYAASVLGIAGKDPTYGMGATSGGQNGTTGTTASDFQPSDLAFWRGTSGDFASQLQSMAGTGGAVSSGSVTAFQQAAGQVTQGTGGPGLSGFQGQCVGWVEQVLPWVPYGPSTAADYATALTQVPGVRQSSAAAAQPGDVVVFAPGQDGADSTAGHIAVVTGVSANGDIQVSQANWDENGLPSVMTIPAASAQGLSYFSPPPQDVQSSAQAATASVQAALGSGGYSSLSNPGAPVSASQAQQGTAGATATANRQSQSSTDPSADAVAAFAQAAMEQGIDPDHLSQNISQAISMMRMLTGQDTMSLQTYGQVSGMDPSAMLDYFRSQPHSTYPSITAGQFQDTAMSASLYSLPTQKRQPTSSEVARFAAIGATPAMMQSYYQQTAGGSGSAASIPSSDSFSVTKGGITSF